MSAVLEIPGEFMERTIPGGTVTFEHNRDTAYRAYHFRPEGSCPDCDNGRVPGKRDGTTKKCPACDGSALPKRRRLISVTTLLDCILPKGGLPWWSETRGIEGAVEAVRLGEIDPANPASVAQAAETVRRLKLGADKARDEAADRGLNVHDLLRVYMETGAPPNPSEHDPAHHGYIRALTRFLLIYDIEPIAVEEIVADVDAGYAGRYDLCAKSDGEVILWDAKTQENGGIYSGAHLQVALYRRGLRAIGDGDVDSTRIVVFAANGEFRVMDSLATPELVDAALTFARLLKPVDSACASQNRVEKAARA